MKPTPVPRNQSRWLLFLLALCVAGCSVRPATSIPPSPTFSRAMIPAKVLVTPVHVKRVLLDQPWEGHWADIQRKEELRKMPTEVEKAFQVEDVASAAARALFEDLQQAGAFTGVMQLPFGSLSPQPTVPELQSAAKRTGADLVVQTDAEFEGRRYLNEIEGLLKLTLTAYDALSGEVVWKSDDTFIGVGRAENFRSAQALAASYQQLAATVAVPGVMTTLLPKMVEQVAFKGYKPAIADPELAARMQSDVLMDVDILPDKLFRKQTKAYAVVVGIENYRDLPIVDFAARDAKIVRQYLIKVLGVPEENIILLLNERAARSDMETYFETWLQKNVEPGSTVYVFYAGHGAPNPKTQEAYLIPYDGNPAFPQVSAFPLKRLYDSLATLPANHVIVWLDSCFSGAGGRSVIAKGERPVAISLENPLLAVEKAVTDKLMVLTAASGAETTGAYHEKRHGLFTYYLLKGLGGAADRNQDRNVDVGELYDYVKTSVQKEARMRQREQTPQLLPSREALKDRGKFKLTEAEH